MKYTKYTYPKCSVCGKKVDCERLGDIIECGDCPFDNGPFDNTEYKYNCTNQCTCTNVDLYKEITKLNQQIIELEDNICRLKKTIKERLF